MKSEILLRLTGGVQGTVFVTIWLFSMAGMCAMCISKSGRGIF